MEATTSTNATSTAATCRPSAATCAAVATQLKEKFIREFEREIEKRVAKKAVKKGVAAVPVAGWIFTVGFMVVDIANGEDVVDAVASNIPYVGVAYDGYRIVAELNSAEAAFEKQFYSNAEPLDW